VRDESARQDDLEQLFDHQIRRRFGQEIAKAMGAPTDYGSHGKEPGRNLRSRPTHT
jgi:hypothetical protein